LTCTGCGAEVKTPRTLDGALRFSTIRCDLAAVQQIASLSGDDEATVIRVLTAAGLVVSEEPPALHDCSRM
jgi:hypothetical protein